MKSLRTCIMPPWDACGRHPVVSLCKARAPIPRKSTPTSAVGGDHGVPFARQSPGELIRMRHVLKNVLRAGLVLVFVTGIAKPASADWLLTPYAGIVFN